MTTNRATSTWVFVALLLSLAFPAPAFAQDGGGMEQFEEVDPYTQGDPEKMKTLGYESFGPFPWLKGENTDSVAVNMGAIPILWVETEHFQIGSSLTTYKIAGDKEEKERLKDELAELKKKLGKKTKFPKRELDPWLRLHLIAQRLEGQYAAFHEDFGLEPSDYEDMGPYLGQTKKLKLLVCQRKSEYSRHARQYLDLENDTSYRFGWTAIGMGFTINDETIRSRWFGDADVPHDSVLYATISGAIGQLLLDAYRQCDYGAPEWLKRGYSHVVTRRFDPRYMSDAGYEEGQYINEDDWKWEPRVSNLVKNDFFVATSEMFTWPRHAELNKREHLVAWSRVAYLLEELEGDKAGFLRTVCAKEFQGSPEIVANELLTRNNKALHESFGLVPDELDEQWAKWVKKTYKNK